MLNFDTKLQVIKESLTITISGKVSHARQTVPVD